MTAGKPRKTYPIETLRDQVNQFLAMPDEGHAEGRAARSVMGAMLESILLKTDNYRGFRYLNITWTFGDDGELVANFGDETRRHYH